MHLLLRPLFSIILYSFLLAGCRPTTEPAASDYDYFPLETGRYCIYDVQENQYSLNTPPIERLYQIKEVIGPVYTDVTGQTAYRLIRYRRSSNQQPWQPDSVWSARIVNNEAIRTENGQDFVKLLFPLSDRLSWNGNRHSGLGENRYELRNNNQPYGVLDKVFNETVTVVAQDDSTLISQQKQLEVYARQVGVIYKQKTQVQFCIATPACIGQQQIDYGIQQVYRIRAYGTE
jgi:hypothetical protein